MYLLNNGTEISKAEIISAFKAGNCRLIHGHADNRTTTGLLVDGTDRDTRGNEYSMWDEVWTHIPDTTGQALNAARVRHS